ncbi:hypothetical protein [Klebsiella quasipneumoniae]|uniref:hypothetical protein n=1 Tax=Klebsiella quasipneumoniae TaxID=1463165 RepID=UPI00237D212B|nr:hypothetical protein [Klebsiella quasipneumoniae]MDE1584132.1 hypothetical protein [Klebsiella quasipneumoniae]MDE1593892.1 hypothetical protein [Klebsiella quasipneumoniae]MDE1599239.1 hypothetical protein [Klebsiella quasipneumoniae]MDE1604599.1 hypothetical protein [Klebsiella quasipneumoniae]MDE1609950.1 hypothetical protein [Klebsiella quasipneumoniae]
MTITLQAVNELIASLESAGEPSIREQKFLKLSKAFNQLAAENVEAKKIISECREYFIAGVMNRIRPTNEGYLHMICDTFADETPATDRIVAGIKADGVEMFALMFAEEAIKDNNITTGWKARASRAASEYAELLREGADK